jgi:enediyne biosynthesis protein E4
VTAERDGVTTRVALLAGGVVVGVVATGALGLAAISAVRGSPATASGPPSYIEETAVSGVEHIYDGEFQFFVGGGVATFDCDDDGLPDLFLAGGSEASALYVNTSETGGELAFARADDTVTSMTEVAGAYPIDIDSDGVEDLVVLRAGENVVLRGLGACRFERANETWSVDGGDEWTVSFSAMWEDGESFPTMAFGNYLAMGETGSDRQCEDHALLRPNGEEYSDPAVLSPGLCTLSILFSDWGRTGTPDLRMTNDRHYYREGGDQLWRIEPGTDPSTYSEGDGWNALQIWGMGIASQDVTGDGLPEVFLTSQGDNKLQTLSGDTASPTYEDIALAAGVTAHRPFVGDTARPSTAWHAEFGDVNNDGYIDLFVTKGNVDTMPEFAMEDPNNLLIGQPDETYVEAAPEAGLIDQERSRGGALVDLNGDGLLDVVVVERRVPVRLWRNTGSVDVGYWLGVSLDQGGPNRDGIGSWIEVRVGDRILTREVVIGGGHAGGQLGPSHFGLGASDEVEVRVIWPDGEIGPWIAVETDRVATITRGTDEATYGEPSG